jgi:hypothetical protein
MDEFILLFFSVYVINFTTVTATRIRCAVKIVGSIRKDCLGNDSRLLDPLAQNLPGVTKDNTKTVGQEEG